MFVTNSSLPLVGQRWIYCYSFKFTVLSDKLECLSQAVTFALVYFGNFYSRCYHLSSQGISQCVCHKESLPPQPNVFRGYQEFNTKRGSTPVGSNLAGQYTNLELYYSSQSQILQQKIIYRTVPKIRLPPVFLFTRQISPFFTSPYLVGDRFYKDSWDCNYLP